jgi:hypothetical protein
LLLLARCSPALMGANKAKSQGIKTRVIIL